MEGMLAIFCAVGLPMCIPIVAIWAKHQRTMMEMKLQMRGTADVNTQQQIEALRQEIRALRDTTMQYDISFDTALQRMESRVENMERRVKYSDDNDAVTVAELRR